MELHGGAQVIGLVTRVDPALANRPLTESYLTQPLLFGHLSALQGRVSGRASIDFEGLTMPNGELVPGANGEGFVDRRHPHTYLHEMILSGSARAAGIDASLAAGRGFAPFGTDDPMVRPFVKYPANHHWSQILERWTLTAAARRGPATVEGGLFNGDEPTGPRSLGKLGHFADSWATRLTLRPLRELETQASYAFINSPENITGLGVDQRKRSASARYEHEVRAGTSVYGLLEWAETDEYTGSRKIYIYNTTLAEAALRTQPWKVALRFERTTRPEEEREADPFRTPRPQGDENILGATRWNTISASVGYAFSVRSVRLEPFAEAEHSVVREVTGSSFHPSLIYGSDRLWTLSLGLRAGVGMTHGRMGRYGVALPPAAAMPEMSNMMNRNE